MWPQRSSCSPSCHRYSWRYARGKLDADQPFERVQFRLRSRRIEHVSVWRKMGCVPGVEARKRRPGIFLQHWPGLTRRPFGRAAVAANGLPPALPSDARARKKRRDGQSSDESSADQQIPPGLIGHASSVQSRLEATPLQERLRRPSSSLWPWASPPSAWRPPPCLWRPWAPPARSRTPGRCP